MKDPNEFAAYPPYYTSSIEPSDEMSLPNGHEMTPDQDHSRAC